MTRFLIVVGGVGFRHPRKVLTGLSLLLCLAGTTLWLWPPNPQLNLTSFLPEGVSLPDWRVEAPRETLLYRGKIPKVLRQEWLQAWTSHPEVELVWDSQDLPPGARSRLQMSDGQELTWLQLKPGVRNLKQSQSLMEPLEAVTGGQGMFLGHSPTRILLHWGKWREAVRVGVPSLLLVLILPWILFGSPGILFGPVLVAIPVTLSVLCLYGQLGNHFSFFSFTLVPVLLCLSTLDSIFLISRLIGTKPDKAYLDDVLEEMARPCLLTTVTTGLGLGTLAVVSDIPVIQEYGAFGLIGVVIALPLVFLLVPMLYRWGAFSRCRLRLGRPKSLPLAPTIVLLTVVASWGLPRFMEGAKGAKFFAPDHPYQQALDELESHFGSLFPIRFNVSGDSRPERLFLYAHGLEQWLYREGLIGTSLAPWTGREKEEWKPDTDWNAVAKKSRGWIQVEKDRPVRVSFLAWSKSSSAPHFQKFEKYLENFEKTMMAEFTVEKSGAFFVIKSLEQDLVSEMWKAFALCVMASLFVVVGGAIGWRVLPIFALVNLVPVVGTLGLLGWLGYGAESGLLALPCLLFGIVVDDTIHLFCSYEKERNWHRVFERNLGPLILTSLLLGGIFAIQMGSFYAPNRAFGLGGAIGVGMAFGWDRWVLPALVTQGRKLGLGRRDIFSANHFHRRGHQGGRV